MSKTVKWILFGLGGVIVLLVVYKMVVGNKETGVADSSAESIAKYARRTCKRWSLAEAGLNRDGATPFKNFRRARMSFRRGIG